MDGSKIFSRNNCIIRWKIGGSQIFSGKKIAFSEKMWWVPKKLMKNLWFWEKFAGGSQIMPETNFRHMFRKFLPDPSPRLFQPTRILVICAYPPVIPDLGVLYKGIVVVTCWCNKNATYVSVVGFDSCSFWRRFDVRLLLKTLHYFAVK